MFGIRKFSGTGNLTRFRGNFLPENRLFKVNKIYKFGQYTVKARYNEHSRGESFCSLHRAVRHIES
jgi:hypothetical protein